jgi:hypothetical protein
MTDSRMAHWILPVFAAAIGLPRATKLPSVNECATGRTAGLPKW